jgi:multidrug efflux pump subunit AcrA (membrane-fusion protein)
MKIIEYGRKVKFETLSVVKLSSKIYVEEGQTVKKGDVDIPEANAK